MGVGMGMGMGMGCVASELISPPRMCRANIAEPVRAPCICNCHEAADVHNSVVRRA